MSDPKTTTVEVRLPTKMGYEKVAMNTAASVANLMGFDDERIEDLKTAVAEACINAMEHGNKLDEALSVGVILSVGADSLEVKVLDTGSGTTVTHTAPDIDKKHHAPLKSPCIAEAMGVSTVDATVFSTALAVLV